MIVWLAAALVGATAGLHTATWGMYKDSLHEGFSRAKYARSVLVGAAAGMLVQRLMGFELAGAPGLAMLFCTAYVTERGALEFYKSFLRTEDQSKYFIPMQFAVGGRVVHDPLLRRAAGAAYAAAVALVVAGVAALERTGPRTAPVAMALLLGSVGGWVSAFGGAWKDAPKEGFQLFKFFRSPAIAAAYGLLLSTLTTSYVVIAFGALGFTVATIETHKTFGKSREPRGKFAGKPVRFPDMVVRRRPFARLFATIWVGVVFTVVMALASTSGGMVTARALRVAP